MCSKPCTRPIVCAIDRTVFMWLEDVSAMTLPKKCCRQQSIGATWSHGKYMSSRTRLLQGFLHVNDLSLMVLGYFLQSDVLTWLEAELDTASIDTILESKHPTILAYVRHLQQIGLRSCLDIFARLKQVFIKMPFVCNRSYCYYVARDCVCDDPI